MRFPVALVLLAIASASMNAQTRAGGVARPAVARLSAATVQEITSLTGSEYMFLGLLKSVQDSTAIFVGSNRQMIASANARARSNGGRFRPTGDLLADTVIIRCGDEELGQQLECSRLAVSTKDGKRVQPLSYSGGPKVFRNGLGAVWSVRQVTATFPISPLKNGFVVLAVEPDGTEWTLEVSANDAEEKLLLRVGDPPPERLNVSLQPYSDGWRVWNNSDGYTWKGCVATLGTATSQIGSLIPKWKGPVSLLKFEDFKPAQPRHHEPSPSVACFVAGRLYDATLTIEEPF